MNLGKLLVKNRKCGSCSVCCHTLRIEEPTLNKLAGVPCQHLKQQGGCSIYSERPSVCQNWYCGWRLFNLDSSLRPDRCGVLIRYEGTSLCFQPIDSGKVSVLLDSQILNAICSAIDNKIKVQLSIPTREGYCSSTVDITEAMFGAVKSREYQQIRSTILKIIQFAANSKTDPISPLN